MRRSRPRPLGGLPLGGVPSPGLPLPGLPLPGLTALPRRTGPPRRTTPGRSGPPRHWHASDGTEAAADRVLGSSRTLKTVGSLVVCLLLAGFGFFLSRGAQQTSSSGSAAAPAAAAPAPSASSAESNFVVAESGTRYQPASLAAQVRARLAASGGARSGSVNVPGPRSSSAAAPSGISSALGSAPSAGLRGCVLRLTGGALPRLVDRATYQGEAAYIIASSSRVWVAGLGCTAADTEVIASVPLAGLPGESPRPSIG